MDSRERKEFIAMQAQVLEQKEKTDQMGNFWRFFICFCSKQQLNLSKKIGTKIRTFCC
jgi:hypothetical protein